MDAGCEPARIFNRVSRRVGGRFRSTIGQCADGREIPPLVEPVVVAVSHERWGPRPSSRGLLRDAISSGSWPAQQAQEEVVVAHPFTKSESEYYRR